MPWFRKNKKVLMAVLVGFLMFTWGILPALRHFATDAVAEYGKIRGRGISPHMIERAGRELDVIQRAGFMEQTPVIKHFILSSEPGEEVQQGRITGEVVWRYLILTQLTEEAGVRISDQQVAAVLQQFPAFMQDQTTRSAIKNWMAIIQLTNLHEQSYGLRPGELWTQYAYRNHGVRLQYVEIDPGIFARDIEVSDEEVRAFYDKHKEDAPDPEAGIPGYMAPERVKLEYAYPDIDNVKEEIEIAEEDIRDYYEENREEYRIEDENAENDVEESVQESQEDPESDDEAGETDTDQETVDAPEQEQEETRYRPLSEVREEIRRTLVLQKAEEKARRLAESVMEDLDSLYARPGRPLPLQQIAARHGIRYVLPVGEDDEEFLSRREVEQTVLAGEKVAELTFNEMMEAGFPEMIEGPQTHVIVQLLQRKDPAPEPFERVEYQVREDLVGQKSLEMAAEFAEELKALAEKRGFRQAVEEMDLELVSRPETTSPETPDDPENNGVDSDEDGPHYLRLTESELISLEEPSIAGVEREDMIKEILRAATGDLTVIKDPGYPPAIFVVEKVEESPADPDGFEQWVQNRKLTQWQQEFWVMRSVMEGRPLNAEDMTDMQLMLWNSLQSLEKQSPPPSALR